VVQIDLDARYCRLALIDRDGHDVGRLVRSIVVLVLQRALQSLRIQIGGPFAGLCSATFRGPKSNGEERIDNDTR
jgi:hypothetical protein